MKIRKTVVPSDSGYLTTEGSEKTIGDVCHENFISTVHIDMIVL
jgi:hypothetical protein